MAYQRCTRCVMDNASDRTITFDSEGHCNYCSDVLRRMPAEYFPDEEGKRKLDAIVSEVKEQTKNDPYDCLVGASGGIDSSYILYLGHQYGLRMLAIHIDDGLDNPIAVENLRKLTEKTGTELISISPDREEYADLLKSLFKASVPNLALGQDNLIVSALQNYGIRNHIKYSLDGSNFAHESILERDSRGVNFCDKKFLLSVQRRFGSVSIRKLELISLTDRYLKRHIAPMKHIRPLNYVRYNLDDAIHTLEEFCGFQYYGGKHYESILTRFLQCYYLPVKFGVDKRKSHFSSLIMSGQMTRAEAVERLSQPTYPSEELLQKDKKFLADYMGISTAELDEYVALSPRHEKDYPHSILNEMAPVARKFRKLIE